MLDSLLLLVFFFGSLGIFFVNNIYWILGIFLCSLLGILFGKIKIRIYKSFIVILIINFLLNYFLSNFVEASLVTLKLLITFLWVNLLVHKISINRFSLVMGKLFHSRTLYLIIAISLSFIPIMIEEIAMIKKNFYVKNYPLTLVNILKRPSVFVITFFMNIFKRIDDLEKVLITRGIEEI